jgi:cell division protease FtsH
MLSTALPTFIFDCLVNKVNHIKVYVNRNVMSSDILGKTISIEIPVVLDSIREGITADEKYVVAVHELGHAIVYGLLYGVAPRQVCLSTTSPFTNGFILPHEALYNKDMLLKKAQILLAGRVAEEIVFGNKYSSCGATNDIHIATTVIWQYIARLGFDGFVGSVSQKNEDGNIFDLTVVSGKCEEMMKEAKVATNELLSRNIPLFKRMLEHAIRVGKMESVDIIRFFGEFGITLGMVADGDQIISGYKGMAEKFLEV